MSLMTCETELIGIWTLIRLMNVTVKMVTLTLFISIFYLEDVNSEPSNTGNNGRVNDILIEGEDSEVRK